MPAYRRLTNTGERTAGLRAGYVGLALRERERMSFQDWELGKQGMDVGDTKGEEKMEGYSQKLEKGV